MEEGKEHYGPASKDYFWLLGHLLDSLSEDFVKGNFNYTHLSGSVIYNN